MDAGSHGQYLLSVGVDNGHIRVLGAVAAIVHVALVYEDVGQVLAGILRGEDSIGVGTGLSEHATCYWQLADAAAGTRLAIAEANWVIVPGAGLWLLMVRYGTNHQGCPGPVPDLRELLSATAPPATQANTNKQGVATTGRSAQHLQVDGVVPRARLVGRTAVRALIGERCSGLVRREGLHDGQAHRVDDVDALQTQPILRLSTKCVSRAQCPMRIAW